MEKQWIITSGTVQLGNNVNWDVSIVFQGTLIYNPCNKLLVFNMVPIWISCGLSAPWPSDSANGEVLDSQPRHWVTGKTQKRWFQWGRPSVINEKDIINEGFSMIFATFDDWRINPEI